jgi:CubicO group peptidase (beta-lactamase class C family)
VDAERFDADFGRPVREAQANTRLPSVSAAVFRGADIVWTGAAGLADAEAREPASPDHQYRIGSITKTFTACAVMQLRDAGALDLDDPLDRHVAESPHGPAIRRVLAHLSGLQREIPGEIWESMEPPTREDLLAGLGDAEQVLAPGRLWHYSNLAYSLLGEVVARVSGMPYERYVQERLLDPVGLERTTWQPAPPVAKGYSVDPYTDEVHLERYDVDVRGAAAAGALWSTAADLCRWGAFLAEPKPEILAPETVEEMRELQVLASPWDWSLAWGLGLMLYRRGERIFFGHDGGMPGHLARLAVVRDSNVGAAVLVGATSAGAPGLGLALDLAEKALEVVPSDVEPWEPEAEAPPPDVAPILGRWWSEGGEWIFGYRRGRLEARAHSWPPDREATTFEPLGDGRYRTKEGHEAGELLRVVRDEAGEVVKLYWATYPFTRAPSTFGVA